jgi:hypothetical protein
MRNLLYVSALVALGGCGLNEEKFSEQYVEKYCEEWAACNTVDAPCPLEGAATGTATAEVECDFDKAKANECLDGTYVCNTDFPGLEIVESPAACSEVCPVSAGTTDTDAAM